MRLRMFGLGRLFWRRPSAVEPGDLPPNSIEEVLDRFVHPDGKRRAEVWRRRDGFFGFSEEVEVEDEYAGVSWSPACCSGLYATHEEALRDARAEIPWLADFLT